MPADREEMGMDLVVGPGFVLLSESLATHLDSYLEPIGEWNGLQFATFKQPTLRSTIDEVWQ